MWVARDKDGILTAYVFYKPYKCKKEGVWSNLNTKAKSTQWLTRWILPSENFPEVKWEDEKPTEVELIIKK